MAETETAELEQTGDEQINVEEFTSQSNAKVQLDIEDAPFLVDEEPSEGIETAEEEAQAEIDREAEIALRKRKRIIIGGLGTVLLILVGLATWFLVFRQPAGDATPGSSTTVVVVPSPESIISQQGVPIDFEPFWVPQKDANGKVRFLQVHFSSESTEEKVRREVVEKKLILRDAIYYYLRNKTHEFMLNHGNLPDIKDDLLDIINGYLTQGKLEELFVENYLK